MKLSETIQELISDAKALNEFEVEVDPNSSEFELSSFSYSEFGGTEYDLEQHGEVTVDRFYIDGESLGRGQGYVVIEEMQLADILSSVQELEAEKGVSDDDIVKAVMAACSDMQFLSLIRANLEKSKQEETSDEPEFSILG